MIEPPLERFVDTFYNNLTPREKRVTKIVVRRIARYMDEIGLEEYLIAGVGGILRRHNAKSAKDIDLAVVGLKYSSSNNLGSFVDDVTTFFEYLKDKPILSKRRQKIGGSGSGWVSGSGGRFKNSPKTKVTTTKLDSHLKELDITLGPYNSLGFQVTYTGCRPIDIQFVFNQNPKEWMAEQNRLKVPDKNQSLLKSDRFFYATLYEQV